MNILIGNELWPTTDSLMVKSDHIYTNKSVLATKCDICPTTWYKPAVNKSIRHLLPPPQHGLQTSFNKKKGASVFFSNLPTANVILIFWIKATNISNLGREHVSILTTTYG